MTDGACEDQVQPVRRGVVEGPVFRDLERLLKAAGRMHGWMSYPLRGETTTMDMSPPGQPPWHVFTFHLMESSAAAFRADVEELGEAIEEAQGVNQAPPIAHENVSPESPDWVMPALERVAEKDRDRGANDEAATPPKVVQCRLCRAWHLEPLCELPAPSR